MVSVGRIYHYIYWVQFQGGGLYKHLRATRRWRKKRLHRKHQRGQIPNRVRIDQRPEIVVAKARFGFTFNVIKNIEAYPFPGSQGSYGWFGSWGPYFRIDPKQDMIMILMTQMKGWHYSRREIFENHVYNAILDL